MKVTFIIYSIKIIHLLFTEYWMIINVLIVEIIFMIFSSNSKQSIKRSMFSLIATGWFLGAFDNVFSFLEIIS